MSKKIYTKEDMEKAFEAGRNMQDRVYGGGYENKFLVDIYTFKTFNTFSQLPKQHNGLN